MGWRNSFSKASADPWWRAEDGSKAKHEQLCQAPCLLGELSRSCAQVQWSDRELKAIMVAVALQESTAKAGASRQVTAACFAAGVRSIDGLESKPGCEMQSCLATEVSVAHLSIHERLIDEVEAVLGAKIGICELCRRLKMDGHAQLASAVSNQHRCRKIDAHPKHELVLKVRNAIASWADLEKLPDEDLLECEDKIGGQMYTEAIKLRKLRQRMTHVASSSWLSIKKVVTTPLSKRSTRRIATLCLPWRLA